MISNFMTRGAPAKLNFLKQGIQIDFHRLENAVPGLAKNLRQACSSYICGLIDMDEQFIKGITSAYLFNKIQPEIQVMKQKSQGQLNKIEQFSRMLGIRKSDNQSSGSDHLTKLPFKVCPYVVFGGELPQRFQQHPFESLIQISRNRYIAKAAGFSLSNIMTKQTYGFRCYMSLEKEITVGVTLEGSIDQQQYCVVDLGDQLLSPKEV